MKKMTVISGKGGTGKTTVVANLAVLADNLVLADCDVDAPNLHLLMKPDNQREESFKGAKLAVKDENKCINCGKCYTLCNFGAITVDYEVNNIKCEGCGLCGAMCPTDAFELMPQETGKIYFAQSGTGPMIHAKLKIGAENSGKLVSKVKEEGEKLGKGGGKELLLIDGSPGIGCPVIASLNGVDAALIVTEPTKSGLADLKRVLEVTDHFSIPGWVVINKYDLNKNLTSEISRFCSQKEVPVIGKIPFSSAVVKAMRQGKLLTEDYADSEPARKVKEVWEQIAVKLT